MMQVPVGQTIIQSQSQAGKSVNADPKIHEIVDINFGKKDIKELNYLKKMAEAKKTFHANVSKLSARDKLKSKEIDVLDKANAALVKEFDTAKNKYLKALEVGNTTEKTDSGSDKRNAMDKMINPESKS